MLHITPPAPKVNLCRRRLISAFVPFYPRWGQLVSVGRHEIQRIGYALCFVETPARSGSGPRKRVDFHLTGITVLLSVFAVGCSCEELWDVGGGRLR
jgi:hypothetical protein